MREAIWFSFLVFLMCRRALCLEMLSYEVPSKMCVRQGWSLYFKQVDVMDPSQFPDSIYTHCIITTHNCIVISQISSELFSTLALNATRTDSEHALLIPCSSREAHGRYLGKEVTWLELGCT